MVFDVLIKGGCVIDGTGNAWFKADVAVERGRISEVGRLGSASAERVIDATGLVVCPGFIDIHAHGAVGLLVEPRAECLLRQGITTFVAGNCGMSVAPIKCQGRVNRMVDGWGIDPDWSTFKEFFGRLERQGMAINLASLVGNGTVRRCVIGVEDRKPTKDEVEEMKSYVAEAMEDGAVGLSSGLYYVPSLYADTEELVELCKVVARYRGFYATHYRNLGHLQFEAVKEAIEIGERAGVPVQLSHLMSGFYLRGKDPELLRLVEEARERGVDVTADTLAYNIGPWGSHTLIPTWGIEGSVERLLERLRNPEIRERIKQDTRTHADRTGGSFKRALAQMERWDRFWVWDPEHLRGKSLEEVAELRGMVDPYDAYLDIILEEEGRVGGQADEGGQEDLDYNMAHPFCMPATDSGLGRTSNPRDYGTFARVLGWYVRDRGIVFLEEAIRKSTSLPAQKLGFRDRGLLREGMWADIVIFNPRTVRDKGSRERPHEYPEGIPYVLVNGRVVVDNAEHTGDMPGRALRHRT